MLSHWPSPALCCCVSLCCCCEFFVQWLQTLPRPRHYLEKQRLLSQDRVTNQTFRNSDSDLWEDMFFPSAFFLFFLVSPGRSEGSSGLTSLWRHIASRPKPLVVVLFLSPFQITQNKAELLYIIAALHITLHCFFTIDFFVSLFLLQFLSAHETWQQLCYSQCLFKYLQVQLVSVYL